MRIIYQVSDNTIAGIIMNRITSTFPPSGAPGTAFIDIDYSQEAVDENPIIQKIEHLRSKLIGMHVVIAEDSVDVIP